MTHIKILGIAMLGFCAATGFARAADMIDETPQAPEANFEETAKAGWAGGYGGLYGGYGKGKFGDGVSIDASGFQGGAFAGANMQSGPIVYGLDADVGYGGAKGTSGGVTAKKGINGALRARLGYDVGPALIYGAAGGTLARVNANDGVVDETRALLGYTVGAGIDAKLTDKVFARGEYRYNSYAGKNYALTAPTEVDLKQHEVRLGVGLQF